MSRKKCAKWHVLVWQGCCVVSGAPSPLSLARHLIICLSVCVPSLPPCRLRRLRKIADARGHPASGGREGGGQKCKSVKAYSLFERHCTGRARGVTDVTAAFVADGPRGQPEVESSGSTGQGTLGTYGKGSIRACSRTALGLPRMQKSKENSAFYAFTLLGGPPAEGGRVTRTSANLRNLGSWASSQC